MVTRNRQQPAVEPERSNENRSSFSFPSDAFRTHRSRKTDMPDDLISSLSDAYENRRARQVNEWERRQSTGSFA